MERLEDVEEIHKVKPALLFIPDISGYTKFLHNTRLSDSKVLIHKLLEVLIDSNILQLKIGEIEGDAVVFYQLGPPPDIHTIECQVKKTFLDFQKALYEMEQQDTLLATAKNLTLKIIVHYGEIITTDIKGIPKLLGPDLVLAHRILKNNIKIKEYLLMTEQYLQTQNKEGIKKAFSWSSQHSGRKKYDHLGTVHYKYFPLTPLRSLLPEYDIVCR
ncbi:MAG: DUF2652 domain-containing protein [Cytophagaceae bacterium]